MAHELMIEILLPVTGIILGIGVANEKRCYYVTPSLIGQAHT